MNKQNSRAFYESINNHNVQQSFDDFIAEDLVNHTMGGQMDRQKWLDMERALVEACPDLKGTVLDQVEEADKVVTHFIVEATHTGNFMGMPATGNTIRIEGVAIDTVRDGKIKEHFAMADFTGMMRQFGGK